MSGNCPSENDLGFESSELGGDESMFRGFIENLPVLFYAVKPIPPFTPLYVSPEFERFGYGLETWSSDPDIWVKVIHPDDKEWVFQATDISTQSDEAVDYEYRILDASGMVHWVRDRGCLIRDTDGEILYREGVILDITARKQAEEALRISEERFRNLFENANDIIYVHDLQGNYISMNHAAERIFGYTREEALQLNMSQIAVPEHIPRVKEMLEKKVGGSLKQTAYEVDCLRKNGTRVTLEVNSSVIIENGVPVAVQGIARDITERKRAGAAIRESEKKYRDLFANANDLIYTHDLRGNFTSLNRAGERITGYTSDEAISMNISQVVAPSSMALARKMTALKIAEDVPTTYEIDIIAKDGRIVSLELSTRLIYENGQAKGVQGIGRDITGRRQQDEAIKASEQRYRQLSEGIFHHVWTATPDGLLDYANERMLNYFNLKKEDLIGRGWQSVVHPDDLEECKERWTASIQTGGIYEIELRLRGSDGTYRWHKACATCGRDENGSITKWFGTNTDIDDQKQSEEKLNFYARHDPLTNLPNRAEFMNHLRLAIDRADNNSRTRFAVLFLDLDRFKVINDSLGHVVGDGLLRQIAERLTKYVRPGDVVARLGGDEFTILLNRTGSLSDVIQVAERVQRNLSKPFQIGAYEVFTSASIGIIVSDEIMRQPEDFLRDADAAMYRAKDAGKARYEIFDREMHAHNLNLLQLETDLRHAIDREEFELLYQPIFDLTTQVTTEFEALLRWKHPKFGLVGPDDFVGSAEESGLIIPIGNWIISKACRQLSEWQRLTGKALSISVNLSAKQLLHPLLVEQIKSVLRDTELSPNSLKLEVTETKVMEHSERSMSVLSELAQIGVSLSTDDFGTGYSSLSYLQKFPFDRLKIDRSFIDAMGANEKSAAIVKTILMLGENLGIEVVAEGIETSQQLEMLQRLGCRIGQGYLFSRPVNAAEAELFLVNNPEDHSYGSNAVLTHPQTLLEVTEVQ
ncbi:MAG TPA: PAS domain S-box protein [Pyrinomonadaceae bacterium]|nr:PAS domain S-box protein [Pyrinomonadaceae bacterium]